MAVVITFKITCNKSALFAWEQRIALCKSSQQLINRQTVFFSFLSSLFFNLYSIRFVLLQSHPMALWYTVAPSSQKKGKRRKSTSTLNLSDQSTHPSTSAITNFIQRYKLPQILYCRYFCHLSNGLRIEKLCCSHVWYILFWKDVLSFFHVSLHLCMGLYSWNFLSKYRDFESKRLFLSIFLVSIHCQTRCWLTVCWGCSEHAHCRKLVYAFNSVLFTLRGVETWTVQTALRMLARCVVRIDKRSCFFCHGITYVMLKWMSYTASV